MVFRGALPHKSSPLICGVNYVGIRTNPRKSKEIQGNQRESKKIQGNPRESKEIQGNPRESKEILPDREGKFGGRDPKPPMTQTLMAILNANTNNYQSDIVVHDILSPVLHLVCAGACELRETCIRKSLVSFRISFGSNFGYWVPPLNVKFKNVTSCRRESNSIRVGPCSHQTVGSDASSLTFFRRKDCIHTTRKACMRVQSAMSDVDVISLISASLSDQENLENLPHPQSFMRCC